jgi:murein DD-endopeptidase MepM/ murein hydrolase activator NlpD
MTILYPIKGDLNKEFRITSPFGIRKHPITGKISRHNGVDFVMVSGKRGEPILAPENSEVLEARKSTAAGGGYGYYVKLRGLETGAEHILAHMVANSLSVKSGQKIKAGDVVGKMGTTGASTGVHLHWETRVSGKFKDPIKWYEDNASPTLPENFKAWFKNNNNGTVSSHILNAPRFSKVRVRQNGTSVFNKTVLLPKDAGLGKTITLVPGRNRLVIEVDGVEVRAATYTHAPTKAPSTTNKTPPSPQASSHVNDLNLATRPEQFYVVKPGDNLTKIARENNTTIAILKRINNIKNANLIRAGQVIKLP